jgi:Zn-dependent protease
MKCNICGVEESMPFRCNYCDGLFCDTHRIPINHSCPSIDSYMEKRRLANYKDTDNFANGITSIQKALNLKSSKTEIIHLSIATILVTAVGMSLNGYRHITWQFIAVFISAFLVHELAHKFLAQYYGSWAEFRAQVYGLIITAISALPLMPFKFIAPGAVMVGLSDKNKFGRVALIGPLTNIVMGLSFYACAYLFPYHHYLFSGASFNGWIALFNLLPFGVLDGEKIFAWNKIVWGVSMAAAMGLFILSYI